MTPERGRVFAMLRVRIGVTGIGAAAVFVLAGCGALSASQTAHQLQRVVAPHSRVHCVGVSGAWNYSCRITPPRSSGVKPVTTQVMVNAHKIVDIGG
jgi:hypothetical protein